MIVLARTPGETLASANEGGGIMSQTIELESIRRLDIKPGEILVATLPRRATQEHASFAHAQLKANLPDGVEVLVVTADVDLSVLCPPSPASPADT
jgi:hypothetical protein